MKLFTVGDIARKLRISRNNVHYLLLVAHVEPVQRAGHIRLFAPEAVEAARQVLLARRRRRRRSRKTPLPVS